MTDKQRIAYEWAKNQNYPSVAARYAKEIASLVDELQGAIHNQQNRNDWVCTLKCEALMDEGMCSHGGLCCLHESQRIIQKKEPLTLDELRQMDGEPVWCEIYIKGQPSFYGIVHGENVTGFIPGDDKPANLAITNVGAYGLAWLAYRQKPEEGTV